jgi:hypothetical protein
MHTDADADAGAYRGSEHHCYAMAERTFSCVFFSRSLDALWCQNHDIGTPTQASLLTTSGQVHLLNVTCPPYAQVNLQVSQVCHGAPLFG